MRVEWYDDTHTLVYWELSEHWTWDEFHAARRASNALILSQPGIVHVVIDMRLNRELPLALVPNAQLLIDEAPPNVGYVIVIASNLLNMTLLGIVQRTFRPASALLRRTYMVRDMDEALEKLRSLPPLTP